MGNFFVKSIKVFFIVLVIITIIVCSGCSTNNTQSNNNYITTNHSVHIKSEPQHKETDHVYNINEATNIGGLFIREGDKFYQFDKTYEIQYNAWTTYAYDYFGYKEFSEDDNISVPNINISGDRELVTFDNVSTYTCYSVKNSGFIALESFELNSNFPFVSFGEYDAEEINGLPFNPTIPDDGRYGWDVAEDELRKILDNIGCYFIYEELATEEKFGYRFIGSHEPNRYIKIGYYEGTTFIEKDITCDDKYFYFTEKKELPVEKTKNGYFVVNTSSLESGEYVFYFGSNWYNKYVVNIIV